MDQGRKPLFWVPVENREELYVPPFKMVIGVPQMNSTVLDLSNSRFGRKWIECIDKGWAKGEAGRRATGVRKQYLKVFKYMNRRVERARCLLSWCLETCFRFSDLRCTYGYQSNYNEWSRRYRHAVKMRCNGSSLTSRCKEKRGHNVSCMVQLLEGITGFLIRVKNTSVDDLAQSLWSCIDIDENWYKYTALYSNCIIRWALG